MTFVIVPRLANLVLAATNPARIGPVIPDETGTGVGQASFYALDKGHIPGSGSNGLR